MKQRRPLLQLLSLALLLATQAGGAEASLVCDRLRMKLANTPESEATTAEIRSYSSAIARQNLEIRKTIQDRKRLGCTSGSITVVSEPSGCDVLNDALDRMENNKRILTSKREGLERSVGQQAARNRVLAAMRTNGCGDGPAADLASAVVEDDAMIGELRIPDEGLDTDGGWTLSPSDRVGTLRTLCVRTCDGAFFPISSNATPLSFRRDAAMCQQMCPGTETELYYHSIMKQESAEMVSATTGRPYREMPGAFAYLGRASTKDPSCSCNLSAYYDRARQSQPSLGREEQLYSSIKQIRTRPAKPDEPIEARERPYDPARDKVRQVGPTFLPTETSSIDLKNPALDGPQPLQQ
ncbi:DUF2865 domain-containing protein [Ciceribacter sp. L1K23]|uniref:DUF2865 domain-containing protein n=1 Tax=Ciceribacter sp. L1K23 TaxID=2820276 RepID=UPI001B81D2B1|nr:DUF2865 domain-containing protein [Ciceribacter sp. L1K23]